MEKCSICNKTVIVKTSFGKEILCKKCGSLINITTWNKRDFISMDDLLSIKNNTLILAKTNNLSESIINSINDFFNEYINDGFITTINGKAGQTLKVFEKYCIVTTKNDSAEVSLINMFYQFDDEDGEDDDEVLTADDKLELAKGILKGGLVKTGIGIAMSTGLKQSAKDQKEEEMVRLRKKKLEKIIKVGDKKLLFENFSGVDTFSKANTANGYLKFIPNGKTSDDIYECEYFFFNNSIPFESKKIKQKVENVKNVIAEKLENISKEKRLDEDKKKLKAEDEIINNIDVFEEIRKYKQLLDEEIITEEEFQAKKKELLNL